MNKSIYLLCFICTCVHEHQLAIINNLCIIDIVDCGSIRTASYHWWICQEAGIRHTRVVVDTGENMML